MFLVDNDKFISLFLELLKRIIIGESVVVWLREREYIIYFCFLEERIGFIRKFLIFLGFFIFRVYGNLWLLIFLII